MRSEGTLASSSVSALLGSVKSSPPVILPLMLYPTLQPGQFQQTLIRSFTLGGIGMQTGEYGEWGEACRMEWMGVSMQSVSREYDVRPTGSTCMLAC